MVARDKSARMRIIQDVRELEDEEILEASRVMAGIAAAKCRCKSLKHTACGLSDVMDALALTERLRDIKTSQQKVV